MRTAFAASGVAAILAGTVGFFLVLRGQTFAGHALSHVGFTGATGAVLFGLSPLAGLVGFTFMSGIGMGLFGEKLAERDVAIGMMLSLALGLGLLFLHFYTTGATQAAALLFGNVLGVDNSALMTLALMALGSLVGAGGHRPAAHFRLPAKRARRGARRADSLRLGGVSGDRGHRGRGMLANRRRAAGVHADGRPRRGGAEFLAQARRRRAAGGRSRARRGMGRSDAGLLHRLADQFLDHGAFRPGLSREPRRPLQGAVTRRAMRERAFGEPCRSLGRTGVSLLFRLANLLLSGIVPFGGAGNSRKWRAAGSKGERVTPCGYFLDVESSALGRPWRPRLDAAGELSALAIAQIGGQDELIARVLAGRGVKPEAVERYLDPSLRDLMPDPFCLRDMEAATGRLKRAVEGGERIAIFGDYDVDGACSAALMSEYLAACGVETIVHIPDRATEGYGPNGEAILGFAAKGARLVVTVDCGAVSHEPFELASRLGLDVIVFDHHQAPETLPKALALVDPNREDDLSGLGYLAGAGVVLWRSSR